MFGNTHMTCSNHSNHGHCPAEREDLYDYGLNDFPEEWSDWPLPKEKLLMPTSCVGEDLWGLCVSLIISCSGGGPPIVMEGQDVRWLLYRWLHFFGFSRYLTIWRMLISINPNIPHWHPFIVNWTHPHSGSWTHTEARHDSTSGSGCQRVSHTLARARLLGSPEVAYRLGGDEDSECHSRLASWKLWWRAQVSRWKKRLGAAWSLPTCTSSEAFAFKDVKACVGRWCLHGVI